jgi:hypothetical protein
MLPQPFLPRFGSVRGSSMTTFGFGSGSSANNRNRKDREKIRKKQLVRRSVLESLETRNLMTTGPQLIGVQPNEGSVVALGATSTPTVLNVSPREMVLRFDDTAAIDANTLSGIQIKRAGADGVLSAAYLSTDLGTSGLAVVDFSASLPGQQGNGTEIRFTQSSRVTGVNGKPASYPILSVSGQRITIDVNVAPGFKTTAADLVKAMNEDAAVSSMIVTSFLRGASSTVIADTVPVNQILTLQGADSARASTNFNSGSTALQVEFISTGTAATAGGIRVEFTSRSFDTPAPPNVIVNGTTIRVELNSNPRAQTTVREVIAAVNGSTDAQKLVIARLISGSDLIRIGGNSTSYSPLLLVGGDDQLVTPAYIGLGDTEREVVIRFAEALPDDDYLIDIFGTGPFALRNTDGFAFNGGVSRSVRFDLDLGPTIQAVVPQPVVTTNGVRQQLRNVIYVYFNGDSLSATEAVKPIYYQLVHTKDTLFGGDDVAIRPVAVNYDANLNRVALTFDRNLDALVDPANPNAGPIQLAALRLRIGNDEAVNSTAVTQFNPASDPGNRFDSAFNLGGGWLSGSSATSAIINSEIRNTSAYPLDFPGANDESGNRDNRYVHHVTRVDQDGIEIIGYNFASQLGNANQSVQLNAITEIQKGMVRQVVSLYEKYLGVRFVESDNQGFTIAVGDMQAIDPTRSLTPIEANRPGGLTYAAGPLLSNPSQSAVVIDSQDFNNADDNLFGTELFRSFMRGIGVLLGLGNADELPQSTIQNNTPITDPNVENVFPGNADIIHGQFIFRPESRDIDLYRFTVPARGGQLTLQAIAERQDNSSLLDASLRLYRNDGTSSSPRWVEVAANEDYFSEDPRISLDFVPGGEYVIGVTAKGNTSYDPSIDDSGLGGRSEGVYQLRLDFRPPAASTLTDADDVATPIDGDGDGRPGGVFNYWFVPTRPDRAVASTPDLSALTIWVDKTAANNGNGTLASPYNTISRALTEAANATAADTTGRRVVAVRILGNTQSRAYEIGFNRLGQSMADGTSFDVPRNVNVMIDAGAIIKLGRARISVGSSTVSVNRNGGSLQLLGRPDSQVIVTSINDTTGIGVNPDRTPPAPAPGDWGGIDFRNRIDGSDATRVDKERNGLFLNSVIHSDVRFGGGQVVVDGVSQVITPINIIDSRPMIANSLITRSADAAMSATPNSFREDDFKDPRSQAFGLFVPDYDRVGPDIHGNRVVNNTINGLFVKTRTGAGQTLETITASTRFDDIDITHVLGENLIVAGTAGGGVLDVASPPTTIVTLTARSGGSLVAGNYNYRLVYVDSNGNESLASIPTVSLTVVDGSSINLGNLPPISNSLPYIGRRIYRSDVNGGGTYRFVAQINAIATNFVDNGTVSGAPLAELTAKIRPRLDGSLAIDSGIILKNRGSRIEVANGAQLLAEGSDSLPIVMTSINDNTYGFGGTFDTAGNQGVTAELPGDWGGVFIGHGSSASLDFNRIRYAGGTTRIEGGFASFNAIEVHQGDFRIANSRIEESAAGIEANVADPERVGRGTNAAATVFVRGAQPVILNNRINDSEGAAIHIDVNSLNNDFVSDPGRSTGTLQRAGDFADNQGALVRGNRLSRNQVNGMVVRGQTLTTQSVWDDTDIVHVVQTTVTSDNFHTYGGLQLKSAPNQSLVVKFGGTTTASGLTATGTPLDFDNRVGGSIQVIGQPGFPVVLTSIGDDSVGAGFGIDGRASFDTDNNGADSGSTSGGDVVLPTGPEVDRGILIDNDVDTNRPGFFSFEPEAGGDGSFFGPGGITAQGTSQLFINENVIFAHTNYIDLGSDGRAFPLSSTTITLQPTLVSSDLVASEGTFPGNNNAVVRWRVESRFNNGVSKLFNTLFLQSDQPLGNIQFINYLDEDIESPSDDFLYLTGTPGQSDFRAYTIDSVERIGFSHAGFYEPGLDLVNATYLGFAADSYRDLADAIETTGTNYSLAGNINLTNLPRINDPILGQVFGLGDVTTALAWQMDPTSSNAQVTSFLELVPQAIQRAATPGAWNGVTLQTYSNDRNVGVQTERESARASAPSVNDTPANSQYLGQLSRTPSSGDENTRLGFEIQGVINKVSDVDVYSFTANGGTEVWFDIDRTGYELDTVIELVSADGEILVLSDDSYFEETAPGSNPIYSILSGNSANPLRRSSPTTFPQTSRGEPRDDYSTNEKDAGMRVILPGQASEATLYHIRVRSSNQFTGQATNTPALTDPASVGQGRSKGAYQLQVRLSELQELPGSYITYADVRFATNGISLNGVPRHSPLVGEAGERSGDPTNPTSNTDGPNNTFAGAQELGNLLQTDRKTLSISGSLASADDVDWFTFTIDYPSLVSPLSRYLSTVFDLDYADGIGRADTAMYLFRPNLANTTATLVQMGNNSNILDDRATSLPGADNTDLGRGSTGTLDPFIGNVELPAGRYYLAVTNRTQVPAVLANRLNNAAGNPANTSSIRLNPVNSSRLIVEDRVGDALSSTVAPITPQFLTGSSRVEYTLGDVPMYLLSDAGLGLTDFFITNPFTGQTSNYVGQANIDLRDAVIRPNGELRGFRGLETLQGDAASQYVRIDTGTATATSTGTSGIVTRYISPLTGELALADIGIIPTAVTVMGLDSREFGFMVARRPQSALNNGVPSLTNILYAFNPNSGQVFSDPAPDDFYNIAVPNGPDRILGAGTTETERGFIETAAAPGATSTSFAVTEATVLRSGQTSSLVNDGDTITLRLTGNLTAVLEFNSGPELLLNLDPVNAPLRVLAEGDQFVIDGVTYVVTLGSTPIATPGVRTVFYSTSMDNAQFANAVSQAVPASIEVGFEGNRMNFKGAVTADFRDLLIARPQQSGRVATDVGSNGNVAGGRVAVNFLAQDTAETIAARVVQAINSSGFLGLSGVQSVNNPSEVQVLGGTVVGATGSTRVIGIAPGGLVTGIAGIGQTLYAVSRGGGLYRVGPGALLSNSPINIATYVTSSYQLQGIQFTGLTAGPENVAGGAYTNLLFGTDGNGTVYAFDTNGVPQNVFANGAWFVSTGVANLAGISFSNLDFNLWHPSERRSLDSGHGVPVNPDGTAGRAGGTSWYFGYENGAHNNASFTQPTNPLNNPRSDGQAVQGTYNFAGGAIGVMESQSFSLAGTVAADLPTLYFNYFLSTQEGSSADPAQVMRDSLRVYGMGDNGQWVMLATNNNAEASNEQLVDNNLAGTTAPQVAWRQARVDLGALAGSENVQLRFEFSTAGGLGFEAFGGRGVELRARQGSELRDGQVLTVGGRTFEIEMGPTLVFPGGAGLANGDTFSIRGSTFVFWNGTGAQPTGNVIRYAPTDSAAVVAQNAFDAISAATYIKPTQTVNLFDPASGSDTLSRAISLGISGEPITVTANGAIGDNPNITDLDLADLDIDLVSMNLEAGATIVARASSSAVNSPLDPFLRLFDEFGTQLSANNDVGGTRDAEITYTVPRAGRYYLGVSGSTNTRYNPSVANSGSGGGSTGLYQLTVDVTPRFNVSLVNNRVQLDGVSDAAVPVGSNISVDGSLGLSSTGNLPIHIQQEMTAAEVAIAVQAAFEEHLTSGSDRFATFSRHDEFLDMTSANVTDAGPFTITGQRAGDDTSEYTLANRPAFRARANEFEGVYLDDFLIGLAERGETVSEAAAGTDFVSVPSAGSGILVGTYQLEIRGGSDYGTPLTGSGITYNRAFEPNQQLAEGLNILFNDASQIADGQQIILNDGVNTMTLEFADISLPANSPNSGVTPGSMPIPYDPTINESSYVIASRVRDLINSPAVQSVLRTGAISTDGSLTGQNTREITLLGSVTASVPTSVGFVATRSPNVRFNDSSRIVDGQTLVINDGMRTLTLEFDNQNLLPNDPGFGVRPGNVAIPYDPTTLESAVVIADRVLQIINSPAVQSVLQVTAFPLSGLGGQASDTISIGGAVAATLPSSIGAVLTDNLTGDRNTKRDQGQVIVENSRVSFSSGFGISVSADARDPVSGNPNPGSVRNTITLNNQRLIPGAVVMNNELFANASGGINISGEANAAANLAPASVPFARVVNNSILGGTVNNFLVPPASTVQGDFYALGSMSFADSVVRYDPRAGGGPVPVTGLQVANAALGGPNYTGIGEPLPGEGVVSLGRGGVLIVRFDDNILTASNDARPDLAVYEVGTAESVRVEVSSDGVNYTSVGSASFNNRFIDLDAYGFNSLSQLYFVRLTDEPNEGATSGDSVGADIDAVGALSSKPGVIYTPSGVGIQVGPNASPTLMNNILVNNSTGISVSATSTTTVIGGSLYQRNQTNVTGATAGQFAVNAGANVPLFTDTVAGNLYPLPGAPSIDASIDSLVERSSLLAVKQPLGLAASPIIAPSIDITGALRVDDPNVVAPPGLGEGIFKDRGASDRSDFLGPTAIAINPQDNDALGKDSNPTPGVVELVSSALNFFDLQVLDVGALNGVSQGTGVNPDSVSPNSVLVYKNGAILVEGLDYRFGYDSTSHIIRLTPLSGLWESGAAYTIRFINTNEFLVRAVSPSMLIDGTTLTVLDSAGNANYFELDTGIRLNVPGSPDGFTNTIADGTIFRLDDGFRRVTFEFDNNDVSSTDNVVIDFSSQDPPNVLAERIANVVASTNMQLTIQAIGDGDLQVLGSNLIRFLPETSRILSSGATGITPVYGLRIPTNNGLPENLRDGQRFAIQKGDRTVVFELDGDGVVTLGNTLVPLNTFSVDIQAGLIVAAINGSGLGLNATFTPGGYIAVGTEPDIRIQATNTVLEVVGIPGRVTTNGVAIDLKTVVAASQVAEAISDAMTAANMIGIDITLLGSRVFIEGSSGVAGLGSESVAGIRDRAGNAMRASELNGDTVVTIFLGEGLDYGDAPDPAYPSKRASNGARHKIEEGFSLGATVTADPDARIPDGDLDDGVSFSAITSGFTGTMQFSVQGITLSRVGFVSAWIDFNGNGTFDSSEKLNIPGRIVNGLNAPITFNVPAGAVTGQTVAARVRLSSDANAIASPLGEAIDGEVEDVMVTIGANPYTNPNNRFDVNADTFVSPIDVLQIVNYINAGFPSRPQLPATNVPPYLDVDSDGFIGPLDVLAVINFINSTRSGGGAEGEGFASEIGDDLWITAATAAPHVDAGNNAINSANRGSLSNATTPSNAVDSYLAMYQQASNVESIADSFDWSVMNVESETDGHATSLVSVLDEVLEDLF